LKKKKELKKYKQENFELKQINSNKNKKIKNVEKLSEIENLLENENKRLDKLIQEYNNKEKVENFHKALNDNVIFENDNIRVIIEFENSSNSKKLITKTLKNLYRFNIYKKFAKYKTLEPLSNFKVSFV
jgi:indole-3-glycerol phosphate synthase